MSFSENRYLLILTENYAALPIMQQHLLRTADDAVVIFGSSFPNDQEYTQVKIIGGKTMFISYDLGNTPLNFKNNTLLLTEFYLLQFESVSTFPDTNTYLSLS